MRCSMEVIFYTEFSKRKNSTKNPTTPGAISVSVTKEVKLKGDVDKINPTFFVTGTDQYVYCKAWGMYYFVHRTSIGIDGAQIVYCNLDFLGTWRESIRASTFFIDRCADPNYYNVDLRDDALSAEDMVSSVTSASTYCGIAEDLIYVVKLLGRDTTNGIGTFIMNRFTLGQFFSQMWVDIDDGLGLGDLEEFMQMWLADPARYVVGVYSSPIGASNYVNNVSNEQVFIGGHKTNLYLDRINNGEVKIEENLVLNIPSSIYSDFRKTDDAFSQYTIYIPTVGTVPLSPDLMDTVLSMDIGADLFTGDLLFTLKSDGDIVASYASNCYATQSIGAVNQSSNIMSGALSAASAGAVGNIPALINGIKNSMQVSPSVIGNQGGTGGVTTANEIVITCMQKSSAEFPLTDYGRPCCKNLRLGDLSGYVQCGNPSIDINAMDVIKQMINSALKSGVFIE